MNEPGFASARKLARMVHDGDIGCLELLDHFIARVERLDPRVNAVVVRDFERARETARSLDRKRRRGDGVLYGVPITVKESFRVSGLPTSWGFPEYRDNIATEDALAVQRLRAAGAVIFGKTNVPRALGDWQSFNEVYGTTNNPWDVARTPGGSSGGGAAALAAGLTGLECGSDIGGSIRQPAHVCGLFGHKPTWGLLPTYGHTLLGGAAMADISCIGPLARSAGDLALALDLLGRPDEAETDLSLNLPLPRSKTLKGLRVALWAEQPGHATDREITERLHELGGFLSRAGVELSDSARPEIEPMEAFEVYLCLLCAVLGSRANEQELKSWAKRAEALEADDRTATATMARGMMPAHRDWLIANEKRHRMRRAWGAFFRDWDVLLCPVIDTPALPHMQEGESRDWHVPINGVDIAYNELLFWPGIIGAVHLPATIAPLGRTQSGLPIGVQIVGPLYGDRTTIRVARLLEREWEKFSPPPAWD